MLQTNLFCVVMESRTQVPRPRSLLSRTVKRSLKQRRTPGMCRIVILFWFDFSSVFEEKNFESVWNEFGLNKSVWLFTTYVILE